MDIHLHEQDWPFPCPCNSPLQACGSATSALEMSSTLQVRGLLWQDCQAISPISSYVHALTHTTATDDVDWALSLARKTNNKIHSWIAKRSIAAQLPTHFALFDSFVAAALVNAYLSLSDSLSYVPDVHPTPPASGCL